MNALLYWPGWYESKANWLRQVPETKSGQCGKKEDLCKTSEVERNGRVGEAIPGYSVVLLHRRDRAGVVGGEQSGLTLPA